MPAHHAWVHVSPDGVSDRARAAWARSDWPTVAEELLAAAEREGDADMLAPVFLADLQMLDTTAALDGHEDAVAALPPSPMRDAILAFLALRITAAERGAPAVRSAVSALFRGDPVVAATLATSAATILSDRGLWAEAGWFVEAAAGGIDELRGTDAPSPLVEDLWFRMMAVAVLVEWNTFDGGDRLDELSAALAVPRARNLLRAHHAPALVAVGQVLAARGDFGAAAVSIARGTALLPARSIVRASAHARLALVKYRQGDWHGARRAAHAVADVADHGEWVQGLLAAVATLEPAVSGDFAEARARIDEATRMLTARPSILGEMIVLHARIALAIGSNDWSGMLQRLDDAAEPGYRIIYTAHEWRALWGMALRNAGRLERYRELMAEWSAAAGAEAHPYYWAHLALLADIDGDGVRAQRAARTARELTGEGDDPLGRTWARIVVGTILSLHGDATEGMESYEAARGELLDIGADGFARLCTRIIEDTAAQLARASGDALTALTAQQRRIAELVAEGYTSAEIGQILYLSKKTIDFHVANIVSRLGLTSRREVARRLADARS